MTTITAPLLKSKSQPPATSPCDRESSRRAIARARRTGSADAIFIATAAIAALVALPRYNVRTLLILMFIGPPLLAWAWFTLPFAVAMAIYFAACWAVGAGMYRLALLVQPPEQ